MIKEKTKPVCTKCGSDDINIDAYAKWNVKNQCFELNATFDKGHYCENCEGECSIKWIEVKDAYI